MNKVERLLKKLCPNGVEWEKIDKIFDLKNGYTPSKNNTEFWTNGTIPWFRLEDIRQNGRILDNAIQSVSHNALKGGKVIPANSLILSTTATIGEVALITVPFICNQQLTAISINSEYKNSVNIKFYFYYFQILGNKMKKGISTGSFPIISVSKLKKLKIPIPPLEIQEEIVKILDKFTDYVTELTTELTLRQKQYHYYRDKLLSFEDGEVEWKSLGEVARLKNGKDWKNLQKGTVPVFGSGGHMGKFVAIYSYNKPTVLIPRKGSISNLFYIDKPFWNVDTIYYTEINTKFLIPKYFYYVLKNIDLESMATNPTRPSLTQSIIDKIPIPLPSIEAQKKIVEVLDYLFMVINDLENGLPKEIELRQKQYEYYRDKLLSFD